MANFEAFCIVFLKGSITQFIKHKSLISEECDMIVKKMVMCNFFNCFFLFLIQQNMEDKWKAFVKILKEIQTDSRVNPLDLLEDISNCRPKLDRMTIWQV